MDRGLVDTDVLDIPDEGDDKHTLVRAPRLSDNLSTLMLGTIIFGT
jgi:hypothetical protein